MLRLTEIVAWWILVTLIWVLTLTTATIPELVLAVVASLPAAVAAYAARRALGVGGKPSRRWLRWLAHLPATLVAETVGLVRTVASPHPTRKVPLPAEVSRLDRAVAAWLLSATPGSIVVDDRDGELTIHATSTEKSGLERSVSA